MAQSLLFQRHIQRLERKLARCEAIRRRYSWARLTVFLVGGAATWGVATLFDPRPGWIAFITAAILFTRIVILHRRLDHWTGSFCIWQAIYREKAARLDLDWDRIPRPADSTGEPPPRWRSTST